MPLPHACATVQIKITDTASLRDAFCNEIVKLSPLELWNLNLRGSCNLRNFVLSPSSACAKLTDLDLSECTSLAYVLIQSDSLHTIKLHKCGKLDKVRRRGRVACCGAAVRGAAA